MDINWPELVLGGFSLFLLILLCLLWFGRDKKFRRVSFGFYVDRQAEDDWPDLTDTPIEFRMWLARFFEKYPVPRIETTPSEEEKP